MSTIFIAALQVVALALLAVTVIACAAYPIVRWLERDGEDK